MNDASGEVAFVTGAGSGLGAATARALAARGAAVTLFDVSASGLDALAKEIADGGGEALPVVGDVADDQALADAVGATVDRFGGLDTVVANAAILLQGSVTTTEIADWNRILEVNLTGMFLTARHTIPALIERGGGAFVVVSSDEGFLGGPDTVAYCVSKHGVIGLMRSIALAYGAQGIRSNAVCPSSLQTPMLDHYMSFISEEERADLRANHPILMPEDVAAVICHLSSQEARHTNNMLYVVDNGDVVDRTQARPVEAPA